MPLSVFSRRRSAPAPVVERELTDAERRAVPRHLEAVAEALVANRCPTAGCAVSGGALAADGVSLREALAMLASTYEGLGLGEPSFAATDALSVAWSEETLAFLGDVSCEDPLTGLASSAHLRARLAEVYRDAEQAGTSPRTTHALVVVDLAPSTRGSEPDAFAQALLLAGAAELTRDFFPGGATLARVGRDKLAVLSRRGPQVGRNVAELRHELQVTGVAPRARIWIEGLPDTSDAAVMVLSGLAML